MFHVKQLYKLLFTLFPIAVAEGTSFKIYHRGTEYILDLKFKIVELNKSDIRKFPNLQSTINNLKLHLSVSPWLVKQYLDF